VFVDVLAKGGGGGTALERLKPYLLAQRPVGPALLDRQRRKDLGYYNTMAGDAGAERRLPPRCWARWKARWPGRARALLPEERPVRGGQRRGVGDLVHHAPDLQD
jgi:hypothetical protein